MLRPRRGATGVELVSALLLSNLLGAAVLDDELGWATFPSSYTLEGAGRPPTARLLADSDAIVLDTVNTAPGPEKFCFGKVVCAEGQVISVPRAGVALRPERGLQHLVLEAGSGGPSTETAAFTSDDDPAHFAPSAGGTCLEHLLFDHVGPADVHCTEVSRELLDGIIEEIPIPSFGYQLRSTQGDEPEHFAVDTRVEKLGWVGVGAEANIWAGAGATAGAWAGAGATAGIACVTYDGDGSVLGAIIVSGHETTHGVVAYASAAALFEWWGIP